MRTETFKGQDDASVRRRAGRWLRPLMVAALLLRGLDAFAAGGPGHNGKSHKLDGYLQQQAQAGGDQVEQVIVTLKPGTKVRQPGPET